MVLKTIFKSASFIVGVMFLIFSALFAGWSRTDAAIPGFTPPENYRKDETLETVIQPSDDNEGRDESKKEMRKEDIFGSDQVFPFEMGLGNSAF